MHMFSAGVCSLFVSVAILLQNRLGLEKTYQPLASVPFWGILFIAVCESLSAVCRFSPSMCTTTSSKDKAAVPVLYTAPLPLSQAA